MQTGCVGLREEVGRPLEDAPVVQLRHHGRVAGSVQLQGNRRNGRIRGYSGRSQQAC